jgi:1-acyl-sn-glycerol-3-phosphate acyltransferase
MTAQPETRPVDTSPSDLPPGTSRWLHDFGRWIVGWIFVLPLRLCVHGRDRLPATGPIVLVANHSSMLDGPVISTAVRRRRPVFLIKQEMFHGLVGALLTKVGQLAINRDVPDRAPLLAAVRVLRGGGMIGIFPEGTRGSGEVAEARNGAAWLARSANAVVVPVVVRGALRPEGRRRRFRPRVDVLVGEPFSVSGQRGKAGMAVATEQIRVALAALVVELDRLRGDVSPDSAGQEVEARE